MGAGASAELRRTLQELTTDALSRQVRAIPEENQQRLQRALGNFEEQKSRAESHLINDSSHVCQREKPHDESNVRRDDGYALLLPVDPEPLTEKPWKTQPVTTKTCLAGIETHAMSQLQASEAGLDQLAERIRAKREYIEFELRSQHERAVGAVEAHLHAIEAIEHRLAGLAKRLVNSTAADCSLTDYESRSLDSTIEVSGSRSLAVESAIEDCHKAPSWLSGASDTDEQGVCGHTPLMVAARNGQHQRALALVDMQADPNKTSDDGTTALMMACGHGHEACVNVLLSLGACASHGHGSGSTSLMYACLSGHAQCARKLIEAGTDPNTSNEEGSTALTLASDNGHEECVKLLLGAGARVNHADSSGSTSLILAIVKGHHWCAQTLIEAKADVEMADQHGFTALMYSCEDGHTLCTQALIEAGAQIDKVGPHGGTALIYCSTNGHDRCVQMLIELQADPDRASQEGSTALTLASGNGHAACVRLLLNARAHVDHAHSSGSTSLMYACLNGHDQCAQTLIQAHASLQTTGKDNFTMLMAASKGGLSSIIELVLPRSTVDATVVATHAEEGGYSALMYSCMRGHVEVTRQLLQSGANRDHCAANGASAQSLARDNHHFAVCKLLLAETPCTF